MDPFFRRKDKVSVIMGATGTGKSMLSMDHAARFPVAEIINSDKMQVYKGLDKVTEEECRGIPHHLLREIDPNSNFTANDFKRIESIFIAGGSNSYIDRTVGLLDEVMRTEDDETRAAISKIKESACQLQKIRRLQSRRNWNMHRLDRRHTNFLQAPRGGRSSTGKTRGKTQAPT
ncbi:adenylate isopentenyltransferase 5 chloroplastic-like [Prunus yedoensis var. nudiflora]|uniref:Adenylate isopentenyltransferase 5 chloroplastic-like n=1 Tax=Prunus yedoensis var. nudiflora TaxID=2094558 RepID=A0A314Y3R1_PRUYE|nr:adenylate isopentenyltransferase 5 chloroplastic-like [Prunus yedoensis var. nudiflora]